MFFVLINLIRHTLSILTTKWAECMHKLLINVKVSHLRKLLLIQFVLLVFFYREEQRKGD